LHRRGRQRGHVAVFSLGHRVVVSACHLRCFVSAATSAGFSDENAEVYERAYRRPEVQRRDLVVVSAGDVGVFSAWICVVPAPALRGRQRGHVGRVQARRCRTWSVLHRWSSAPAPARRRKRRRCRRCSVLRLALLFQVAAPVRSISALHIGGFWSREERLNRGKAGHWTWEE